MVFTDALIDAKKKVNLLGDSSVGKTSLIMRFVNSVFGDQYLKTIGTNVYTKTVEIPGANIKLIINDIMGEKAYRSVQQGAFLGSTGAIAVADITRMETLDNIIDDWLPRYQEMSNDSNPIVLAVNKFDLDDKEITPEILDEKGEYFSGYFFTSAKTGRNVEECFKKLAGDVAPNLQLEVEDIEDIVLSKTICTTKDLIDGLLAYASEIGEMPYETREEILSSSGIDKYSLDQKDELDLEIYGDIDEEDAINFAEGLKRWYSEHDDEYTAQAIDKLVKKYETDSEEAIDSE
ncbi:MAG: GTP-binding protein [Thermoplasmata archaeon]